MGVAKLITKVIIKAISVFVQIENRLYTTGAHDSVFTIRINQVFRISIFRNMALDL